MDDQNQNNTVIGSIIFVLVDMAAAVVVIWRMIVEVS